MNFSLKPHQFIVHWVPGIFVTFLLCLVICGFANRSLDGLLGAGPLLLLSIAAIVVGQLIDAIRNTLVERLLDRRRRPINWDFFFKCKDQGLENLENYFYVYYVFDVNILIAFLVITVICVLAAIIGVLSNNTLIVSLISYGWRADWRDWAASAMLATLIVVGLGFFYRDAIEIRDEVARFTNPPYPPDKGVYTRLRPSKVHNGEVGVFAIMPISKGTEIFAGDDVEPVWIDACKLVGLPAEIKRLYDDFCIVKNKGSLYGGPPNFNCMTIGWYLNHSKSPNVDVDTTFSFYANRDIAEGEELSVDERTYNEWREPPNYIKD